MHNYASANEIRPPLHWNQPWGHAWGPLLTPTCLVASAAFLVNKALTLHFSRRLQMSWFVRKVCSLFLLSISMVSSLTAPRWKGICRRIKHGPRARRTAASSSYIQAQGVLEGCQGHQHCLPPQPRRGAQPICSSAPPNSSNNAVSCKLRVGTQRAR